MTKTLNNAAKFNEEIILNTKNWDKDRIATIDFIASDGTVSSKNFQLFLPKWP